MPKLKHLEARVIDLLKEKPETKDNDNKLIFEMWKQDIFKKGRTTTMWVAELEIMAGNNQLSNPVSIVRVRRILQAKHPELRGVNYKMRHKEQDITKQEIKSIKNSNT